MFGVRFIVAISAYRHKILLRVIGGILIHMVNLDRRA
jgi:hypothetical protein